MLSILQIISSLIALVPELSADVEAVLPVIEQILSGEQITADQIRLLDSVSKALGDQAAAKAAQLEA
jgi:hypothetical protein